MIAAGIGCRRAVSALQVEAAISAMLRHLGLSDHQLDLIAVPAVKGTEAGVIAAAEMRGVVLKLIPQELLETANPRTLTRSERSMAVTNLNSVAEAAALVALGGNARLLAPRLAVGPVTCALAEGELAP